MYRERFVPNIIDSIKLMNIKASRQIRPYVASGMNVVGRNFSSARVSYRNLELPNFSGEVIEHGDADYMAQCYQYASSSYLKEGIIQPAAIIKAKDDSDVIKAINYVRDNNHKKGTEKIAMAVRTGGHQYSGASSTNGNNIQLNLSQTYKKFDWDNAENTSVTLGVSHTVGELNKKLAEKKRFVPHGQCQYVTMGGHIQTGGYGQLARSFGLLSDYVTKFRIITADGTARWVDKTNNSELFFAVLGGSPGNFGVITDVTLNVLKDEDYPNSRGFRAVYPYDRKTLKALLDVMVEMANNDEFPADYDYCITVLEESKFSANITNKINYDMLYDRGPPKVIWPPMIVVFAQWANLRGRQETYNREFINKIRSAAGQGLVQVNDENHIPMSTLTGHWVFPITREFKFPYIKRTYSSNSSSKRLEDLKWTDWVSYRIDDGYKRQDFKLSAQFFHLGGHKSQFYQKGKNNSTSFSWRDTRLCCTMDAFYYSHLYMDPYEDEEAWMIKSKHRQAEAIKWQLENDKGVGKPKATFCEDDRRLLWGSHDLNLSANHQYYYDQHPIGKYEQLRQIKKSYDPLGVFTPNEFCIIPPEKSRIKLADSRTAIEEVAAIEEVTAMELQEESQLRAEDKFWKIANMKREIGKPVPLWDIWRA